VRRTRTAALATLALLNVVTLVAGLVVAHMLPPRLARLHVALTATKPIVMPAPVLIPAGASAAGGAGPGGTGFRGNAQQAVVPTRGGLSRLLDAALPAAKTGPDLGIQVYDAQTGRALYSRNAGSLATPASTVKVITAVAALAILGANARFTTSVRQVGGTIVLVGGGDPTLAVNAYPSSDYPRPATLALLAADTARALRAQGHRSVRLGYDTSLFSGPELAPGWTGSDVSTGNVTPITALEADQGRLTPAGSLEDSDDPVNYRARTMEPVGMTMSAFTGLLGKDGITVTGSARPVTAPAAAPVLAAVRSPTVAAMAGQLLLESNNVIAEVLARHVAIALGRQATFAGAAAADLAEVHRLGVTTPISLVDGSGLSPKDGIAPETLVRVLAVAARTPALSAAITGLPVAGFTGTLSAGRSVFGDIGSLGSGAARGAARGVVRAKTGNLTAVASLAGLAYDRSGRLLIFAIMAPRVPGAGMLPAAADAIDAAAAGLAACGCG
jgi:D-alanyl-D-alanine carboxypeptidase/D-alanyl-D-alanine-endopeptidase (penicillin-binding protein 4)